MAFKSAPLAAWPWEWMGTYKYWLCAPLGARLLLKYFNGEPVPLDFCFHILLITLLRCGIHEIWHVLSRSEFMNMRIQNVGVGFDQVDREFHWDNYMILQALAAATAQACFPDMFSQLPLWNWTGMALVLLLHAGPTELLYYHGHQAFHRGFLYKQYHALHHSSKRPEPSTAGTGTFLEHTLISTCMFLPIVGVLLAGRASLGILYVYVLGFDFLRNMVHSNIEVVPLWLFDQLPLMRYLLITPSYHSLHHSFGTMNYCLFMPLYDYLGGTMNKAAFELHAEVRMKGNNEIVPDSVFIPHGVDLVSCIHTPLIGRTFSSVPRRGAQWYAVILDPLIFLGLCIVRIWGKAFVHSQMTFHGHVDQSWVLPRVGFQFFLPNSFKDINNLLEGLILEADRKGVKVVTLGGLNKNEEMNGGGALFVEKHKNLKVRVCHGNTLTTAVILRELPKDVKEVFLTGSTSKIGRAIALYLCRKRVRVLMLTASQKRFDCIVNDAPEEFRRYLVRVTEYRAGSSCKTWIVGKWAGYRDQKCAPPGTHFHQFTMPCIIRFRSDCAYGDSAGLRLPAKLAHGVNACEHTLPRYVIYACHAGGMIHALEGWQHHEVGTVDVDKIDMVWDAAMKHGLTPV